MSEPSCDLAAARAVIDRLQARIDAAERRAEAAEAVAAAMRAVLSEIQWCNERHFGRCPVCDVDDERKGHAADCELAAALSADAGKALLAELELLRDYERRTRDTVAWEVSGPQEAEWLTKLRAVEDERDRLRDTLRRLEWSGHHHYEGTSGLCPACGMPSHVGHAADCWLAAALKGGGR